MKTNKPARFWSKLTSSLLGTWLASPLIFAQNSGAPAGNTQALPAPTPYTIIDQGPNQNVWQSETSEQSPDGAIHTHIHKYTEIASGLNFWNNGAWSASQEQILPFAGGAVAQQGAYQVIFANNLNSQGAIDHLTADGLRLRSNILGLAYHDQATGQTVMIATLHDSTGQLLADNPNQILYPDAFDGVKADVRYEYRRSAFIQEVVLREQLMSPTAYGLSPATTELMVCTEFIDPPEASLTAVDSTEQLNDGLEPDQGISWGATTLGCGRAFDLGDQGQVPVSKEYAVIDGRYILFEKVRLPSIAAYLAKLPEQASLNPRRRRGDESLTNALSSRAPFSLPKPPLAQKTGQPIKYARTSATKGFVLDYISLTSSYTNYIFQGDSTYFVSGSLNLSGTNYFEGGAVIKFASGTSITEVPAPLTPKVVFESAPYREVTFTAKDDNTCGQPISGSTGSPSGYYASPALSLVSASSPLLADFKIAYANPAISLVATSPTLSDAQFFKCAAGVSLTGSTVTLENALFSNVRTNFVVGAGGVIVAEQTTFNNSAALTSPTSGWPGGAALALTNCVLANVTNVPTATSGGYNGFYQTTAIGSSTTTTTVNPFQTALGGGCYLTNACAFRGAGTPNIYATLWNSLVLKTTYAPLVYSNASFSILTNFVLRAQRDTNALPDLGYHYAPLDYIVGGVNAYTNLIFSAGTAVGWYNGGPSAGSSQGYGIALNGSAQASFNGTATAPCVLAKNTMVQEGDSGYWTPEGYLGGFIGLGGHNTQATAPTLNLQFTHLYSRGTETAFFRDHGDGTLFVTKANNSEFYCGEAAGYLMYFYFTNCLSDRSILGANCTCSPSVTMRNCTFFGGTLSADRNGTTWPVMIENCAFDHTDFTYLDNPSPGNTNITWINFNTFLTGDSLPAGQGSHYWTTNSYNWQTSWFGNYYLPANSTLIAMGSTTADKIGLYHFTTQTNQTPEGNAVVDIGYHYVATDSYGNPLDNNGDGIPDYIEDGNGDGLADNGETPWMAPPVITVQPTNQTVLAGSAAAFSVTASGVSLSYQWRKNGSPLSNGAGVSGANTSTLTLAGVQSLNPEIYTVVVSNPAGAATSIYAVLRAWSPSRVIGWGNSGYEQSEIPAGLTNAVAVAASENHSIALKNDGTVTVFGNGSDFYGTYDVPANTTNIVAIATGYFFNLALQNGGSIVAWGYDADGETNVPAGLTNVVAVAAGEIFSMALKNDGTVAVWGDNSCGETNVPAGLTDVVAIAAGTYHCLAVKSDGTVVGWGDDTFDQTEIPSGLTGVVAVGGGFFTSLALKSDGTLVAWGWDVDGETNIPDGLPGVAAISLGYFDDLAILTNSSVATWGADWGDFPPGLTNVPAVAGGMVQGVACGKIQPVPAVPNLLTSLTNATYATNLTIWNQSTAFGFLWQPLSQDAMAGDMVTFDVGSGGASDVTYQWSFDGTNIVGATNDSYVILRAQAANAGSYTVVATAGTSSITSAPAILTVESDTGIPGIIAVRGSRQDYVFADGVTYFIGSPVMLLGNTTIQGGAVLKFSGSGGATLQVMGPVSCTAESYFPAILTSAYDDSVGQFLYTPSSDYPPQSLESPLPFLNLTAITNCSLNNLRFCFAGQGIAGPVGRLDLWDCQFSGCTDAILSGAGETNSLHNVLFDACETVVASASSCGEIDAEQVTAKVQNLWTSPSSPAYINLTNSIIFGTINSGPVINSQNVAQNPAGQVFQTVDYAQYYLATTNYCQTGTTNISPRLLTEFRNKTTSPPLAISAYLSISGNLMLSPQAARYTNGAPNQGYYYDALDYSVADLTLAGGNITVLPGTAIAVRNQLEASNTFATSEGFTVQEGSAFTSHGTPTRPIIYTVEKRLVSKIHG